MIIESDNSTFTQEHVETISANTWRLSRWTSPVSSSFSNEANVQFFSPSLQTEMENFNKKSGFISDKRSFEYKMVIAEIIAETICKYWFQCEC